MNKLQLEVSNLLGVTTNYSAQIQRLQEKIKASRESASKRIAVLLQRHRRDNRLKQKTLAGRIGITSNTLSAIETNARPINDETLRKLEKYLANLTE